ncbi:MAG: Gmad2 immunoglobulin-like domain-containing protein [Actinomycetota bacterium]
MSRSLKGWAGVALVATLLLAACGTDPAPLRAGSTPTPTPEPTPETSQAPKSHEEHRTVDLEIWFARGDGLFGTRRATESTPAVGTAAMEELLAGPSGAEADADVFTAIPEGTELLDLDISDGTARVDLSAEFEGGGGSFAETMQLAQVVYTLTQFPTVDDVVLEIDGERVEVFGGHGIVIDDPMKRSDFKDLLTPIVVMTPAIGDRVSSPVTISGTANVFEATVSIRILDDEGNLLAETFTTATCGTGCRGDYSEKVRFDAAGDGGVIEVFESSAEDGSDLHLVSIPVQFGK